VDLDLPLCTRTTYRKKEGSEPSATSRTSERKARRLTSQLTGGVKGRVALTQRVDREFEEEGRDHPEGYLFLRQLMEARLKEAGT
jgi:hypothetical protein